jgi:ribosome-associated heat shock protein Hsp15
MAERRSDVTKAVGGRPTGLRLDKWLWYARFCKSRSVATQLCRDGRVRVNRVVVDKPNRTVRAGDVLTFALGHDVRVIRVVALGERRGPAGEARTLYEDLAPLLTPLPSGSETSTPGVREAGAGRPTKRDRREIDRIRGE